MREFVIMTDSDTEIPYQFAEENDVEVFLMPYTLDDKEQLFDLGKTTDYKYFYTRLREGAKATTSTRPPVDIEDFYRGILEQGKDILYLCFSSQLSAHYSLSCMARETVLEDYPDNNITIVDSCSIAMGAGILVYHAVQLKKQGKSMEEIAAWLEENKTHSNHFFTVDDLMYLKRGGRLSGAAAVMGSILDIKPVLTLNRQGKINVIDKVKGKRKMIKYLLDKVESCKEDTDLSRQLLIVCHGDNEETAREIEQLIKEKFDFQEVWFMDVGPVIGCHAGPGVIGILFMGKEREQ